MKVYHFYDYFGIIIFIHIYFKVTISTTFIAQFVSVGIVHSGEWDIRFKKYLHAFSSMLIILKQQITKFSKNGAEWTLAEFHQEYFCLKVQGLGLLFCSLSQHIHASSSIGKLLSAMESPLFNSECQCWLKWE